MPNNNLYTITFSFFFFQAEDGIRDYKVTGVQTCALPILIVTDQARTFAGLVRAWFSARFAYNKVPTIAVARDCWFGARRSWTRPFFLRAGPDRKSTRLNSSHLVISYAVFCLKKKKQYECP